MGALNSWRESHASPVSVSIAYWFANVNFCGEVAENMFAAVQDTKWRPPKGKKQVRNIAVVDLNGGERALY